MRRLALVSLLALPLPALAFCGFFVSGAGDSLYANATMVVLMREGTRTILSMQNNYQGPPQDFAMVIPVPVVLQKDDVKTLTKAVFSHVDTLAAPRLVEYWEQDPCYVPEDITYRRMEEADFEDLEMEAPLASGSYGVKVEAQYAVGEYDIVVLSARDSGGLEAWLHQEHYNIPAGAAEVLRPYVLAGTRFFVAKVDSTRVKFENGHLVLSPLRFQYNSDRFDLPVRLGLLNSQGQQDLIVHILARNQRYEVANYPNVTIPTNLRADTSVASDFGSYYEDLFQSTLAAHPHGVVTEYSWDSASCDPCPTPPLSPEDILSLGADTLSDRPTSGWVLTRLHYRYSKQDLGEDLVFRTATALTGGRGIPDTAGNLHEETQNSHQNMFQGRYVMLHPWEGPVKCENPRRGRWGGPPDGRERKPIPAFNRALQTGTLPVQKSGSTTTVPEVGGTASTIPEATPASGPAVGGAAIPVPPSEHGCNQAGQLGVTALVLAGLIGLWRRMRSV